MRSLSATGKAMRAPRAHDLTVASTLLAWGALSFGAVYPWAYWPLILGVIGTAAWRWRPAHLSQLGVLALLVVLALTMQLVPLSAAVLERAGPASGRVIEALDIAYANGVRRFHPLSIEPVRTSRAL